MLAAGGTDNSFLSGPLTIRRREVLLIDNGVTLYASLNPADYQIPSQYPANTCGTVSANGGGCYPFITFGGSGSGLMGTRGPDGSIGAVDGRGEDTLVGGTQSWWEVAAAAASGGNQNNPVLVYSGGSDNLAIYQVELKNSPMYHVEIAGGRGLTVWGVQIDTPATARNTTARMGCPSAARPPAGSTTCCSRTPRWTGTTARATCRPATPASRSRPTPTAAG